MKKLQNKAQFYMFGALILLSLVFAVIANKSSFSNSQYKHTQNLLENYQHEAKVVIDSAVLNNKNVSYELRNFTEEYINYGKTRDISLGIIFLYSKENKIHIVNYINEPVLISNVGTTLDYKEEIIINYRTIVLVEYDSNEYSFSFTTPGIDFKTLFVQGD